MVTPQDKAELASALDPLREPFAEALPKAAEIADTHFGEYDMRGDEYLAGRAHLARCHARRLLIATTKDRLGGWTVVDPGPNSRLWLRWNGSLRLKLLRPMLGWQTPPPGSNKARKASYSNLHVNLLGVLGSDLIGLWDVDTQGELHVRIIRPIGVWRYGTSEKVDMDFWLPRPDTSVGELEFLPTDDIELPFPIEDKEDAGAEGSSEW